MMFHVKPTLDDIISSLEHRGSTRLDVEGTTHEIRLTLFRDGYDSNGTPLDDNATEVPVITLTDLRLIAAALTTHQTTPDPEPYRRQTAATVAMELDSRDTDVKFRDDGDGTGSLVLTTGEKVVVVRGTHDSVFMLADRINDRLHAYRKGTT